MPKVIKVLLIEDNPGDARLIEEMLNESGIQFKLECADKLSSGIDRTRSDVFDVILLDLGLPDSQGVDTLEKLNRIISETPVIVLTGLKDEATSIEAVKKGAQDYLVKGQLNDILLARSINYAMERKKIDAELAKNRAMLIRAQELGHIGSWELDLATNDLTWSKEVYTIYGLDPAMGSPKYDLVINSLAPECRNDFLKDIDDALKLKKPFEREYILIRPDGTRVNTHTKGEVVYDREGHPVKMYGMVQDITDQKRAEQEIRKLNEELEERVMERTAFLITKTEQLTENQLALMALVEELNSTTEKLAIARARAEEADRLKSIFLATMSHELRTPLNSIIGFISILLEGWSGELNPEQKEQLELVHSSGKYLLSLINDVIDISKVEAGKIDIYIEDLSLKDVVGEATSIVKVDIDHKGLAMTVDVPDITMTTDRRRLLQCLLNLVSNAVKFTDKGGVTITAKTINNSVCISVTDTGIGITSDDLKKLFAPFVRLESPLTQKTSGTGLGLYLTQKLATEVLGGSVEAVSEYGVGSTFTLCAALRQEEV